MNGKNGLEPGVTEAMAAPVRAQNAGDGAAMAGPPLRFSAKRKLAVVQLCNACFGASPWRKSREKRTYRCTGCRNGVTGFSWRRKAL